MEPKSNFEVKDSGARAQLGGGVRDTEDGKLDYTLVLDGVMYERWAAHLTKGAKKYAARNWLKFFKTRDSARAAYDRAGRSLMRHQKDYMGGLVDEDHAAAIIFNVNVRETALSLYPDLLTSPEPTDLTIFTDHAGKKYTLTGETRVPKRGEYFIMAKETGGFKHIVGLCNDEDASDVMELHGKIRAILRPF
jgi:hypothetical protein